MRFTRVILLSTIGSLLACGHPPANPDGGESDRIPLDGGLADTRPTTDAGPTDVPLAVVPISTTVDGQSIPTGFRLVLSFELGHAAPLSAFLDTGSEGIQIIQSALPADSLAAISIDATATPLEEEFEGGIIATGVLGAAAVTIGDRSTPSSIPIFVIQNLSCEPGAACATFGGVSLSAALFDGYPAIVGVGLRNSPASTGGLGNPIAQLPGQPDFIVEAPDFGGDAGTLRIGPSAEEASGYQTLQLPPFPASAALNNGTPAWDDTAVPTCIDDVTDGTDYCAAAILDSGSPETVIFWSGTQSVAVLPPSTQVDVSVGQTNDPIGQFQVTVGTTPQIGLDTFALSAPVLTTNLINLGLTVFFRYNVYLDPVLGRVGLSPHTAGP